MQKKSRAETGLVSACYGRELGVFYKDELIKATVKGKLLEANSKHSIVSGDICTLEVNRGRYMVTGILKRKSELTRFLEKRDREVRNQVIAANCDQLLAVFSFVEPNINPFYLDLVLSHANYNGIHPCIIFNKTDAADLEQFRDIIESYGNAGFEIILTSVRKNENIKEVRNILLGKKTVLIGPSGSGKSSLLKALNPEIDLKIGKLTRSRRGSHTTSTSIMYRLFKESYIYDTPGFGKMSHNSIDYDIIRSGYPEFFDLQEKTPCEFRDCMHIEEKNCRVKDLLLKGELSSDRYRRYYIFSKNKDPIFADIRESLPVDTDLFISRKAVFNVFNLENALLYRSFVYDKIEKPSWFHYVPFIYFSGLSRARRILIKEINGLRQIFSWRIKDGKEKISLLFLNPLSESGDLVDLFRFTASLNDERQAAVSFLTEGDLLKLEEYENKEIEIAGREYIYSRKNVLEMEGRHFRALRKKIYRFRRNLSPVICRGFNMGDSILLDKAYTRWLADQSIKYPSLYDSYYTENAMGKIDDLLRLDVDIMIAEYDSRIIGFIMGGKMNSRYSNAFIMKCDNSFGGLSYFLKHKFIESQDSLYVNDGIDFGFFGLKQSKRIYNPVEFPKVYRGRFW